MHGFKMFILHLLHPHWIPTWTGRNFCSSLSYDTLLNKKTASLKSATLQVRGQRGSRSASHFSPVCQMCLYGCFKNDLQFQPTYKSKNMTAAVKKKETLQWHMLAVLAAGQFGTEQNSQKMQTFSNSVSRNQQCESWTRRTTSGILPQWWQNFLRQRSQGIGAIGTKARPQAQRRAENMRGNRQACATPALSGGMSHSFREAGEKLFDPSSAN